MTHSSPRPGTNAGNRGGPPRVGARVAPAPPRNYGAMAAGILFIASAVFALLRVTLLKDVLPTEATPGQVYGLASAFVAVGIALVQGSTIARRTVMVLATLGLLLVLAGLFWAVEKEDLGSIVWFVAAAIITIPYLALLALLLGEEPSWLRVGIGATVLAAFSFGSYGLEAAAQRQIERQWVERIADWTAKETSFADPKLGLALTPPDEWVLLDAASEPVARESGRLGFADRRSLALAILHVEELTDGPGTARAHLDRIRNAHVKAEDDVEELGVEPVSVGGTDGQKLTARFRSKGQRMRGWFVAWRDGWRYFALIGWVPEDRADAGARAFSSLVSKIAFTPVLSRDFEELRRSVEEIAPHLSAAAIRAVMDRHPGRKLTAGQVFRLTHRASIEGIAALSAAEKEELGRLTGVLFGHLAASDRARLGSYQERVRFDQAVKPGEDAEMALVMKAGTVKLPPESLGRLQALYEKAIAIGALMDKTG
jgi:hypothetical protein